MDPRLLTQLAIIVELGSVTKAARKLNVTQPTLSRLIMEDRVGGPLLRREQARGQPDRTAGGWLKKGGASSTAPRPHRP